MAFQLKTNEAVGDGITRNVRSQLEKVLKHMSTKNPQERGGTQNEAVFEARKCFKRVRAALRLVRDDLGNELYRQENFCFRDAARPLTEVRDAHVLVEAAGKLRQQFSEAFEPGVFSKIHKALLANRNEVTHRVLEENKAFAAVKEVAASAIARLPDWSLQHDGWPALETGLRRVYRAGHRARALAAENSSVENLHEWRKQSKYLWHQLQLLEATLTSAEKELVDQTHKLSRLLGEDHDLAVLRETLAADPLAYGGHPILKRVFVFIDRRRQELEQQAFTLGGEIYRDSPKAFTNRIGSSMKYQEVQ
jgi:CHAD domain-containing protein